MEKKIPSGIKPKGKVYYDGLCTMCTSFVSRVGDPSHQSQFEYEDMHQSTLPEGLDMKAIEKEIHLVTEDGRVYKNSEAILKILEGDRRYHIWSKIGKLPVIRQLLPVGYRFVANNRHLIFGAQGLSRLFWLKILICVGFISSILLSLHLWVGERSFPLVPVIDNIALPIIIESLVFVCLLLGLLGSIIYPRSRKYLILSIISIAVLAFFDQMRWQPWVYQYTFILVALSAVNWEKGDGSGYTALNISRIIFVSIFIWSGIQKINPAFFDQVYPWLSQPVLEVTPEILHGFISKMGYLVPFMEIFIGIGLLVESLRKYALIISVAMLGFLLFVLGPLGYNWNSVVWPWDIVMTLGVFILFYKANRFSLIQGILKQKLNYQKLVVILFIVMPAFSFFNAWDSYLSFALYSGNTNGGQVVSEGEFGRTDISAWAFDELNVPAYPETRIFKSIARSMCRTSMDSQLTLYVEGKPTVFNPGNGGVYTCEEL